MSEAMDERRVVWEPRAEPAAEVRELMSERTDERASALDCCGDGVARVAVVRRRVRRARRRVVKVEEVNILVGVGFGLVEFGFGGLDLRGEQRGLLVVR